MVGFLSSLLLPKRASQRIVPYLINTTDGAFGEVSDDFTAEAFPAPAFAVAEQLGAHFPRFMRVLEAHWIAPGAYDDAPVLHVVYVWKSQHIDHPMLIAALAFHDTFV